MTHSFKKVWYLFILPFLLLSSCIVIDRPFSGLPPGPWRAELTLIPNPISPNPKGQPLPEKVNLKLEEISSGELPFTFEVKYTNETDFYIEIKNGSEIIGVSDIKMGIDRKTAKDTVWINFPLYDSYIKGIYEGNLIQGYWIVNNRDNYQIPFTARFGQNHRFTQLKKPPILDLTGKWETVFTDEEGTTENAIGEFVQDGNYITGTFLTELGDYRFLEGTVQADKLYMSCFDGSHAFLFEAKIQPDNRLMGSFLSGNHYRAVWEAKRNPAASLRDPNALTYLKEGYDRLAFSFKNTAGQVVSLTDEAYQNKVTLVQILGTWCPNCRDETAFLVDYLSKNPEKELQVIGLSFERHKEEKKAMEAIKRYKEGMHINYELLLAGHSDNAEAAKSLPMLNHIISYPTLIFIDKMGQVRKIHTGFTGPATSKYPDFIKEFEQTIDQLTTEHPKKII
ncbi:MAG: TlpA disulfide reductase family protein [Saprospiraceae bacterium]